MKSLILLWSMVLQELGTRCRTSTTRDLETVTRRSRDEGLSFFTITLPTYADDLQKGLSIGKIAPNSFQQFSSGKNGFPKFLQGFLELVFDRRSGVLLDQPNIDAIFAIRQLTLMCGKVLVPCSDARNEKAIRAYIECEQEVRRFDSERSVEMTEEFSQVSNLLWGAVFQKVDEDVYHGNIIPRHGPGATADKLKGNRKFDQIEWIQRLERVFPAREFLIPNERWFDHLDRVSFLEPGEERPVKVTLVPKTLKTPRIIAIEPTCMQYVQQGLLQRFVEYAESPFIDLRANVNRGYSFVGFSSQEPNRSMARIGSLTGDLATLDLSEASDRVSNQLVRAMLAQFPHLAEAIDACRSRKADVPGHGVIRLAKFASMGSAVCFPVEAFVFTTIIFLGIQDQLSTRLTPELLNAFRGKVRVFGDDIIVPKEYVQAVVARLEAFGFRVNANKSFSDGYFRESCGKEYFRGEDVSIVRLRRLLPNRLLDVQETISAVSFRNQCYFAGLWRTAGFMDIQLDSHLNGYYPTVFPESPILGRQSLMGYHTQKIHPTLHSPLSRGYVVAAKIPDSRASEIGALVKCLIKQGEEPFVDERHLERSGRPVAVDIKLRWASPF